ncbi:hypothetical protein BJ684DRAFT_15398, partial [Piptocephalis cylindrospora]
KSPATKDIVPINDRDGPNGIIGNGPNKDVSMEGESPNAMDDPTPTTISDHDEDTNEGDSGCVNIHTENNDDTGEPHTVTLPSAQHTSPFTDKTSTEAGDQPLRENEQENAPTQADSQTEKVTKNMMTEENVSPVLQNSRILRSSGILRPTTTLAKKRKAVKKVREKRLPVVAAAAKHQSRKKKEIDRLTYN